ncbi:MAG TPA: GNAT family N-acetyltransferase [Kribbella sp.]|jgi:predicted GNAT superfamily acetyltransferase
MSGPTVESAVLSDAWRQAGRAAQASGVEVRQISAADAAMAQTVVREAWGRQQIPQSNLLHALSHAGNAVLAAVSDGTPVGVAFGFLGWSGGLHLHSHMTAVVRGYQSRGIGYALKSWQRALCLEHDVTEMRWTYDPLIARNAYFNLVKLGAQVQAFFPDFYGAMDDTVNAGDYSDRFEVSWQLKSEEVMAALERREHHPASAAGVVAIPADYDSLRQSDPARGREIRLSTREQFVRLFAAGLRPAWADGGYVFAAAKKRPSETLSAAHG